VAESGEERLWKVVWRALNRAPFWTKVFVALTPVALVVLTTIQIMEIVGRTEPGVQVGIFGILLSNAGLILWSLVAVLHAASADGSRKEAAFETNVLFRRIWAKSFWITAKTKPGEPRRQPDDIVRVLPAISVTAACMLAAGSGVILPRISDSPILAIPAAISALAVFLAIKTVQDTIRFLLHYGRGQAKEAADARRHATEAHLSALQAQLNPHFLFNALNTVLGLIPSRPKKAESTVEELAHVLRRTLDRTARAEISLGDEIDYVSSYLAIEEARFEDRIQIAWELDQSALDLKIPPMTIQTLVENSLKHGIGATMDGGRILVRSSRRGDFLTLEVHDTGVGFSPHYQEGTGLGNLRKRLSTLYGNAAQLTVRSTGGDTTVTCVIPVSKAKVMDANTDRR